MGVRRGEAGIPLEIGMKNQKFLENLKSATQLRLIDLILAMARAGMTFTLHKSQVHSYVSCSDEVAVHSCPILCLQRQVAKVASGLFYCWGLLRNNNMSTNLQRVISCYDSRHFVARDS